MLISQSQLPKGNFSHLCLVASHIAEHIIICQITADVQSQLGQNKREGRATGSVHADVIPIRVTLHGFAREWKPSTELLEAAESCTMPTSRANRSRAT